MPEIIEFSNKLCYTSTLKPLRQYSRNRLDPIKTVHVSNGYRQGKSSSNSSNPPEAEAVAEKIAECCKAPSYYGKSMGVISLLGYNQAQNIQRKLLERIGAEEMEKRQLVCGDAYAFQGDERDIIFLSMVAAPGETVMKALASDIYKQRFNVAASRARDQVWLFHTPTLNDFRNQECLRYQLLRYYLEYRDQPVPADGIDIEKLRNDAKNPRRNKLPLPYKFDSWFEVDVYLRIIDKGFRVKSQVETTGYHIDLVVEGMEKQLAVECDGDAYHGSETREDDMRRQRILERCGWTFWRLRGSEFYLNPDKAMESLWEKLDSFGIAPGGKDKDYNSCGVDTNSIGTLTNSSDPQDNDIFSGQDERLNGSQAGSKNAGESRGVVSAGGRHDFSREELMETIRAVLNKCPHNTCTKHSLTSRVCKYLEVRTRGKPLEKLDRRVMKALNELICGGGAEEYKAKNVRIRLVKDEW